METTTLSDDEREDGEICSDDGEIVDDFEDISDYSIPSCGKSDYKQDLLRAISLSSISNSDGEREYKTRHFIPARKRLKNKNFHHRSKRKRSRDDFSYLRNKHNRHRTDSSSSNSSETDSDIEQFDKSTLRKLHTAVRISSSDKAQTNSLEVRLKKMIDPDLQDDEEEQALRTLALLTSKKSGNGLDGKDDAKLEESDIYTDKELADLRLEALKSAVMKKHLERKKRKENSTNSNNNAQSNNKENAESNIISNSDNKVEDNLKINSVNTKISDENNVSIEEDVDVMRAMLLASMSTKMTSVTNTQSPNPLPITVSKQIVQKTVPLKHLNQSELVVGFKTRSNAENSVFVKIPSVKPLIINLNSDSDSDTTDNNEPTAKEVHTNPIDQTVTEFLKKQREEFEAKHAQVIETKISTTSKELLDKSVLKLLSKSQQQEYQLLKQKLLLANNKKKIRKLSIKLKNSKLDEKPPVSKNVNDNGKEIPNTFKKTMQDLQFQIDGRLQMKGKYKELAPLFQKVNLASRKRKLCEESVNRLLMQLKMARTEYQGSHQTFSELVKKLKQAKDNIDQRLIKNNVNNNTPKPVENNKTTQIVRKQIVKPTTHKIVQNISDIVPSAEPKLVKEPPTSLEPDQEEEEEEEVENKKNDIEHNSSYVSPLDNRENTKSNPLKMLCPYELFGVCKDQDCNFNHCP